MRHDAFRKIIKVKNIKLNSKLLLNKEDFDERYFPSGWNTAYVTDRGDQRTILFPISVRLFLARSQKLYSEKGKELPRRYMEKLSISFVKQTH